MRRKVLLMRPGLLSALIAVAAILTASTGASARTESLRWYHPSPNAVSGYRVHVGAATRNYVATIDAVGASAGTDGVVSYTVTVPDSLAASTIYVGVTAYDSSGSSPLSNEKVFQAPAPTPTPTPTPTPGAANSGIDGFRLWNASTDTLIGNLQSGGIIDLASAGGCTAIEILGNAYLQVPALPGSALISFDGESPGTCDNTVAPFAWEGFVTSPGNFACAPSLTEPGSHTLRVTPFDGDNCTGLAGAAAVLTFEVLDGTPPASPEPLGAPGAPFLVQ